MSTPHGQELPACGCASPGEADPSTCYCGVEDILRVIRRRYSLALLNAIHQKSRARYHDLERALPEMSSSTLADTLAILEAARLIHRAQTEAGSARPVYSVTASGDKLLSRLRPLLQEVRDG